MHLSRLSLTHFRNLGVQELDFPREGVAIVGPNAHGKSNLVEAIYYLETFRSFRSAKDDRLVAFDEPVFRVVGTFGRAKDESGGSSDGVHDASGEAGPAVGEATVAVGEATVAVGEAAPAVGEAAPAVGEAAPAVGEAAPAVGEAAPAVGEAAPAVCVAAAYQRLGKKKKVTVDGQEPQRLGDALGRAAAVVFSPSDVEVVSGPPSERRRFLDVVLSLATPGYLIALQRYRTALSQRNAALKAGAGTAAVAAWDEGLASAGSRIIVSRRAWIAARETAFCALYRDISGGRAARITYQPSIPTADSDEGDIEDLFHEALAGSRERERRLGSTVVGPHRDELIVTLGGPDGDLDLRAYGSGGQRRTAALSLRMIEAETVRESRGRTPILLLDDVFAELDEGRSLRILELIEGNPEQQVILTAPKEADIQIRRETIPRWRIEAGVVMS